MNYLKNIIFLFIILLINSCDPFEEEKSELGAIPNPSFTITEGSGENEFILTNTTEGTFLTNWTLHDDNEFTGETVSVIYPFQGTYPVTMTTFNRGGSASLTQDVVVETDVSNPCFGNIQLLTGCTQKTWRLAPESNAMHIGPNLEETWWGNSEADVTGRACLFNDEYIFKASGEYEYVTNGDFWVDTDDSGNPWPSDIGLTEGCHNSSEWPTQYAAWNNGRHSFEVSGNSLSVIGSGAFIGLYKVGTTDEVMVPQSEVTYTIASITENRMVIHASYAWGAWRFTLVSQ